MPVAREKGRRRTASTSSDGGQLAQASPPKAVEWEHNDIESEPPTSRHLAESLQQCCSPKCCVVSELESDSESVKMICSYDKCPFSSFMHAVCFGVFEEQMLSCLRGMSRARNWSEKQRRQNLWTKKGYDLVFKLCTCKCGKGSLRRDLGYTADNDKNKKKRKKSSCEKVISVPIRAAANGVPRTRSRSGRNNSDSLTSSENGLPYMQPFSHRSDYSVFEKLLPRHLVNSYHIKMEDDGYGAGDDTRSFVLSSLAFHHNSHVCCVLCSSRLPVFDQFPLLDGTFYLSPLRPNDLAYEVESKGDDPLFLSAVCIKCLVGINKIICSFCSIEWNGNHHQIGTMYSYDLFASLPCCTKSMQCNGCKKPLMDVKKITLSFSQLSSQIKCSHCGDVDYHFVKPISRFVVKTTK